MMVVVIASPPTVMVVMVMVVLRVMDVAVSQSPIQIIGLQRGERVRDRSDQVRIGLRPRCRGRRLRRCRNRAARRSRGDGAQ